MGEATIAQERTNIGISRMSTKRIPGGSQLDHAADREEFHPGQPSLRSTRGNRKGVSMRFFAAIAASAIVVTACGGTAAAPSPTATLPSVAPATPASTQSNVFTAALKAANENPPIADAESTCSGDAIITFSGTSVKFDVTFAGCPASAVINIGHIHEGAAGVNGPVKIDSSLKAGELMLASDLYGYAPGVGGSLSRTVTADATLISAIMANPVGYYVNFHSIAHSAGVMRGQLTKG